MKKHIHVVGAVIIQDGKILCAKRGPNKALPHLWEFPGGKIDENETPEEALKREIAEEMGAVIEVGEKVEHTIYEYDFGFVHLTTFKSRLISGELKLTDHTKMKWLSPSELETLEWAPADIPAIEKLAKEGV